MLKLLKIKPKTDEELVKSYQTSQNVAVLGELFERYTDFVFLICMKYLKNEEESKDAAMQIFEKLFEDLKKHSIENFKSWLHVVAKNFCLMELRSSKSKQKHFEEMKKDAENFMEKEDNLHLLSEVSQEKQEELLNSALGKLKTEQKECVELFYLQGKSYKEIVDITGHTEMKVKSFIQNGKRNLKLFLQDDLSSVLVWVFFLLSF